MLFLAGKEIDAQDFVTALKGGPGSGFHGHAGRPGKRGGSSSDGAGAEAPLTTGQIVDLMAKRALAIQKELIEKYGRTHRGREIQQMLLEVSKTDPELMRLTQQLDGLRGGRTPTNQKPPTDSPKPATERQVVAQMTGLSKKMAKIEDLRQTFLEQGKVGFVENREQLERLTEEQRAFLSTMSGKPRLTDKMDTSKTKREITENWRRTALLRLFGDGKGSTVTPVVNGGSLWENAAAQHSASIALEFLGQLANTLPEGDLEINLSSIGRANYSDGTINISPKANMRMFVHEIGHFLEDRGEIDGTPIWHLAADELERRTAKSERVVIERGVSKSGKLVEVTSRPDHFMDAYVGRDYKPDKATGKNRYTELVSMGVDYLWSDPHKFAAEDPQLFNFTMAILKGVKP